MIPNVASPIRPAFLNLSLMSFFPPFIIALASHAYWMYNISHVIFGFQRRSIMTDAEIRTFIEDMEELNDIWEFDRVKECYGDDTLEEALALRRSELNIMGNIYATLLNA